VSSEYDEIIRRYFKDIVSRSGLSSEYVTATSSDAAATSGGIDFKVVPPEWFKLPSSEYAIARGKEVIMECTFRGARAHVFTSSPFRGSLKLSEVLKLRLESIAERAVFYGSLNAVMRYLGLIDKTIHCRRNEPIKCAEELVKVVLSEYGNVPTLLIGYQPAMAKALAGELRKLYVTDMNLENIGKEVRGVKVLDHTRNLELMEEVELVLATGSSVINSTLWAIYDRARELGRELVVYGVSAAGAAKVLGIKRYCMYGN